MPPDNREEALASIQSDMDSEDLSAMVETAGRLFGIRPADGGGGSPSSNVEEASVSDVHQKPVTAQSKAVLRRSNMKVAQICSASSICRLRIMFAVSVFMTILFIISNTVHMREGWGDVEIAPMPQQTTFENVDVLPFDKEGKEEARVIGNTVIQEKRQQALDFVSDADSEHAANLGMPFSRQDIFDLFDMVYIISMEGKHEKQQRAFEILEWAGLPSSKRTLWKAYGKMDWGTSAFEQRIQRELDRNVTQLVGNSLSPGKYGKRRAAARTPEHSISLSHLSVYADAVKKGYNTFLVLEDDFCLSPYILDEGLLSIVDQLRTHKGRWDALFLGDCLRRGEAAVRWPESSSTLASTVSPLKPTKRGNYLIHEGVWRSAEFHEHFTHNCFHGYGLSRQAARFLLAKIFPLEWPIDVAVSVLLYENFPRSTLAFHHNLINQEVKRAFLSENTLTNGLWWELCAPLKHNRRTSKFGGCVDTSLEKAYVSQREQMLANSKKMSRLCDRYWGEARRAHL